MSDSKEYGRLGGLKAAKNMTKKQRKERALKAAEARWKPVAERKREHEKNKRPFFEALYGRKKKS